ncbi:hypothetical protein O6H91_12G100000 [Diphasiastrum complanatum]|uniref:Uncharacterized protein n=1 Tax=Diphasiastrum complanatum TaxID=34168 RepID=A0ACC2C551_DIPCM|nr:hypothetical protein O6H91_12G100000 [Diphasiastrum complanatum]
MIAALMLSRILAPWSRVGAPSLLMRWGCGAYADIMKSSLYVTRSKGFTSNCEEMSSLMVGAPHGSCNENEVFSFGDRSNGALGHVDDYLNDVYEPKKIAGLPSRISKVAVGHYHSFAITEVGELWAWGRNTEGQLGPRDRTLREENCQPQRVKGLEGFKIREAAGSGVVSMAVGTDGSVWAWGKSKRGQLGLGIGVTESAIPRRLETLTGLHVVQVSLGWGHALACTKEGQIYSWGYSADGRLGFLPEKLEDQYALEEETLRGGFAGQIVLKDFEEQSPLLVWKPQLVSSMRDYEIIHVSCGMDHSLALDAGHVFSFGDNTYDQLGRQVGEMLVGLVEGDIQNSHAIHINAGLGHSLAVVSFLNGSRKQTGIHENAKSDLGVKTTGVPFSWGWNSAGQLGTMSTCPVPRPVEVLNDVISLAGGRAHSLAVTPEGKLWAWGSGLNGRLGLGSSMDEPFPVPVDSLDNHKIVQAVSGFDHNLVLAHRV